MTAGLPFLSPIPMMRAVVHPRASIEAASRSGSRSDGDRQSVRLSQLLDELRDEFLAIAAHELRTPTSTLRLLLQSMQHQLTTPALTTANVDRLQRTLAKSVQQCDRLVQFGERMLDVSQLQTGTFALRSQEIDLAELVRLVVKHLGPELLHAGCTFTVHAKMPIVGRWDQLRLEEVLVNLLENVIKYAPGSTVTLDLTATSEIARLVVRDSGPGILPGEEERIFEQAERSAHVDSGGGWGLGLYFCRRVVEAHGGRMRVERATGGGAAFVIDLPRHGDQHAQAESIPAQR